MAVKKKGHCRTKSLASSRVPRVSLPSSMSSKATRNLIRTHHNLQKSRAKALANGEDAKATVLSQEINLKGGLQTYQKASLLGQAIPRGGDSSKVLMEWLSPALPTLRDIAKNGQPHRLLEIGALSTDNACSKSRVFDVERIDLNSQSGGITQQDFMQRPLPENDAEQFDMISLSLVLNYVPDPPGRGDMLRRTLKFLRTQSYTEDTCTFFPSLFLVLPAPCVTNSRYLDEVRLEAIMNSLGYAAVKKKKSKKLVYYLWTRKSLVTARVTFKKDEVKSGKLRNNFAIIMK